MSRLLRAALLALAALACLPAARAAAATAPWWSVETGARPTNLWKAQSEVQELRPAPLGEVTVVKLGGVKVACLGDEAGCTAEGLVDTEHPGELKEALEAPAAYGSGGVKVAESPSGSRHFTITASGPLAGRWVPQLETSSPGASVNVLIEGGSGRLVLTLTNLGDAPAQGGVTPIAVTDKLPAGVLAYHVEAIAGTQDRSGPVSCAVPSGGASEISCTLTHELPEYEAIEVEVWVSLTPPLPGTPGEVSVSGGGAATASVGQGITVSEEETRFGIESFSMGPEEEGGAPAAAAGTAPFQFTTALQLNSGPVEPGKAHANAVVEQPALPRNFRFPLPAGLVGNPTAYPICTFQQFTNEHELTNDCPPETAVGVASVTVIAAAIGFVRTAVPVFNLEAGPGEPARFGILPAGVPVTIDTALDAGHEYRITALSSDAPQTAQLLGTTVTLWGDPGDPRHDGARGWNCAFALATEPCTPPLTHSETPFLRLPVSCASPFGFGMELEPWNVPLGGDVETAGFGAGALGGCSSVPFAPGVSAAPTTDRAGSASGLQFGLKLPDPWFEQPGPAEAEPKKIEVTLPEGMTANPAQAAGLGVCTPQQYAEESATSGPGEGCPVDSKIGSVVAHTPLLEEPIEGSLYVAAPHDNPFGSLLALYLVAKAPGRGVVVKQAGSVSPDPRTGQLRSTFDQIPQLPFSEFQVRFRGGRGAPLVTPPTCGHYEALARLVPWSAGDPEDPSPGEIAEAKAPFEVEGGGPEGGPCPAGVPPLHPGFLAGSQGNAAGAYSPFDVHITRSDAEQEITGFSVTLPPGLVGKLAGIPYCSEQAIAAARSREHDGGAAEELASPSCPAASQIGTTQVGAGVGPALVYVPGKLYLAGPYNGAPLSVVAITAAQVGPFDVGTVVIREALRVDPFTAQVSIDSSGSDPLPRIIDGIPVHLRDIRAYTDRPEFTLNPTDCEPSSATAAVSGLGDGSGPASNADPQSAAASVPYQVDGCAALGFKPSLRLSLTGATKRAGHPGLKAVLTMPAGGANIARAQVGLPHALFLDQGNLDKVCTMPELKSGNCPPSSVYGHAQAFSPLLDAPLEGPVYLGTGFGHKLPDLVADLNGQIRVLLHGRVDTTKQKGIRNTFEMVPDAPVSRFVLEMRGGKHYSLIENSEDLCIKPPKASVRFVAQNGRISQQRLQIHTGCKHRHKGRKHKHTGH